MLSDQIAYVALVSADMTATSSVFERQFGLPRNDLPTAAGTAAVFSIGRSALAVFSPGHPLVEGESKPGVHHIALGVDDLAAATARASAAGIAAAAPAPGLAGRGCVTLDRATTLGVRTVMTERLDLRKHGGGGPVERIDHIGVASADVFEDERVFTGKLGFPVESRQTDMEVSMAVESFTSDKYGVIYHSRAPEPVGGLRVCFITVGDCELEFLANFDPTQSAHAHEQDRPGNTRQDQGVIARFVKSRGQGLHHVALKVTDIGATLGAMAAAGLPMIDVKGRPGSRRALIGFPQPRALGGVLMHLVQREA